jgi:hypothetical protein
VLKADGGIGGLYEVINECEKNIDLKSGIPVPASKQKREKKNVRRVYPADRL